MEGQFLELSDAKQRLLRACEEKRDNVSLSLRLLCSKYQITYGTLHRALQRPATAAAILEASCGRGRRTRLTHAEELIIKDTVYEFQSNGTPLNRSVVMDVVQEFVRTLSIQRRKLIGFRNDRPGREWMKRFVARWPELKLQCAVNLEYERAEAMSPVNIAAHFARIKALSEKYGIKEPCQVFNLDESGFSIRGMAWSGRSKRVVRRAARANARQLKWRGSVDHVTMMAVVSAGGQSYTPLFVLPGIKARYRRRCGGRVETPADYLPSPNYLMMRDVAGVDTDIFVTWAMNFIKETEYVRRDGRYILLVYDGFAGHLSYRVLSLFKAHRIIVAGLPAHTSHVLQPLDVGVFAPLKQAFRTHLSRRTVTSRKDARNDVFTICELLSLAYYDAVTAPNIINGFSRSGLWCAKARGPDMSRIREVEYTSSDVGNISSESTITRSRTSLVESSDAPNIRIENARQLYELFLRNAEKLCSDGTVEENGTVKVTTKSGATLTSDNVIAAVRATDERKRIESERKEASAISREIRRTERVREQESKKRQRDEREEVSLQKIKQARLHRCEQAVASRAKRRQCARERALHTSTSSDAALAN